MAAASLKNMLAPAGLHLTMRLVSPPPPSSSLALWPCHSISVVLSLVQTPPPSPHGPCRF